MDKIDCELLVMTYGSLVTQLLADHPTDICLVNKQLDSMGRNIGSRLIDEFLARSSHKCTGFKDVSESVRSAFTMFLGISPTITHSLPPPPTANSALVEPKMFSVVFDENPLAEFVELPESAAGLWFSNVYCGVIRGALEQLNIVVECVFVSDVLNGDATTEISVTLVRTLDDEGPVNDE